MYTKGHLEISADIFNPITVLGCGAWISTGVHVEDRKYIFPLPLASLFMLTF